MRNMKALFNYDERTNYSNICLRFRPVAVILSSLFFFDFGLMIIAAFLLAQLPSLNSGVHSFLPNQNLTPESSSVIVVRCRLYCY